MSRSNDSYKYNHPRSRWPRWHHFCQQGIGKWNKAFLYKRRAKRLLTREMGQDHEQISLTPWNKLTDYSWYW